MTTDESWRLAAVNARAALALLGRPGAACMPGEAERGKCTDGFAEHALSYLVMLREIADHEITQHIRPPIDMLWALTASVRAEIEQQHEDWHVVGSARPSR